MSTEQEEKASDNPSPAPEATTDREEQQSNEAASNSDSYVTMPTLADEKEAPTNTAGIAHHDLANTTFEDDGTFALPPGETLNVTPVKPNSASSHNSTTSSNNAQQQPQQQNTDNTPGGKGAQIFMNRFSNWRQKANENATILYQKAREAQEQAARENKGPLAALRQVAGTAAGAAGVDSEGNPIQKDRSEDSEEHEEEHSGAGSVSHSNSSQSESHSHSDDDDDDEEDDNDGPKQQQQTDPQSTRSLPNLPSRQQVRSRVQNLAGGVMNNLDSVATGFRGRYANEWNDSIAGSRPPPPSVPLPHQNARESQTALILKSRAAEHLQDILNSLQPYEYVMLLGAGRLQVNLKNPYVKHQGTYVDFLVSGGAADKSGVVAVGDSIVKVGSQDVRKHTIADVPSIIAKAKRPVVLVLTTGTEMDVERITYLDLAVAMMHRIRDQDEQQKQAMIASARTPKKQPQDVEGQVESNKEQQQQEEGGEAVAQPLEEVGIPKEEEPEDDDDAKFKDIQVPLVRSVEDYANPPLPPMEARQAYKTLVGKRCNDNFSVTQLSQVAASDDNFRATLRNAFLCCAVDGRRFPFLGRHLSLEQETEHTKPTSPSSPTANQPDKNTPNALLMLFLELMNFSDLHGVTPASRRRDIAQRIAHKFFLPTKVNVGSTNSAGQQPPHRLEPPMFDFHHIVPDSVLRQLETTLNNTQSDIPQDLFLEFQHAVVDALCGTTFLLFLVSNQCARMRAYLRNVAPFVNVPLKPVFEALIAPGNNNNNSSESDIAVHAGAKNYFLFVLIYLMQLEKDPTETLSTDNSTLLGRNGRRMVGAAGGLCCYIYIGRVVMPALEDFQNQQANAGEPKEDGEQPELDCQTIIESFAQLWEVFLASGVGTLEHTWKSRETKEYLDMVRTRLRSIRNDVLGSIDCKETDFEKQRNLSFAEKFATDQDLKKEMKELAENLLYDYATSTHLKFREHVFHDWLCNELVKGKKEHAKLDTADEKEVRPTQLPNLPPGCIKRLLRKCDLPVGVSPHKPIHSTPKETVSDDSKKSQSDYPNADCGIVFGSTVGSDLASQMMSPAMDHSDVRRYSCQDCTLDRDGLADSFEEEMIPPTLESYAVLPSTRNTGFSEVTGNVCLSSDGWEVSMVNFMIPKADDGSGEAEDKSLFGVSLVFQRTSTARFHPRRISQTQLVPGDAGNTTGVEEKKIETSAEENTSRANIDDAGQFPSPISFGTPSDDHWSTFTRNVKVSAETPTFNGHLREKAWIDRVLQDEIRDQEIPATVGVALVSRKNVVIAMRQTLWMLLRDFSRMPDDEATKGGDVITCGSLVDLLGNFSHRDVENNSLRCILEPYIRVASSSWIERPLAAQKEEFERLAGQQLITCLPPIPLALLFVATLLEQKIVLSSSRRSILFSATEALKGMLAPLKWCHLLVPLVPSALAKDLIQYPAPFILGMPSEDPGVMEIMNDLPMDVTLVDLDVGRVILAPEFSFDDSNGSPGQDNTRDLRSQVLYLAQILGSLFGAKLFREAWSCDSPSLAFGANATKTESVCQFDTLRSVCRSFIEELMTGVSSSCFWVEEENPRPEQKTSTESTVLFDEDRFFHIKRWREQHGYEQLLQPSEDNENRNLALSMDGFHLVLETFVRCQSFNWYLSSQPRDKMAFSF